jgi:hypothetical protein
MPTIWREAGFRFSIYVEDHLPAHVHAIFDGELKINLLGPDGMPELVYNLGVKANDEKRAMNVVTRMQSHFLEKWDELHG